MVSKKNGQVTSKKKIPDRWKSGNTQRAAVSAGNRHRKRFRYNRKSSYLNRKWTTTTAATLRFSATQKHVASFVTFHQVLQTKLQRTRGRASTPPPKKKLPLNVFVTVSRSQKETKTLSSKVPVPASAGASDKNTNKTQNFDE